MKKSISLIMTVLLLLSSLPALAASHNDKNTVMFIGMHYNLTELMKKLYVNVTHLMSMIEL